MGEVVQAGEGGGEDDAGVVAHRLRQPPPVGQLGAQCRGLVVQHQRDAGVAQRVDTGPDGEPGRRVQRRVAGGVDAELADHIQRCAAAGQLDDLGFVVDRLERGVAGRALDQAGDVPVEHLAAQPVRDRVDELLTVEDAGDVLVIEDPLDPGQAECRAGHHHRLGGGRSRWLGRDGGAGFGMQAVLDHVDEVPAQFRVLCVGHRGLRTCGGGGSGGDGRLLGIAEPGRVQPAQRLVERRDIADLGVVGEQREYVVAEHVLDEAVQRLLRADLDKYPGACRVQRV